MSRAALAFLALALFAAPAAAQTDAGQSEGRWGAIAYGGPNRATGSAVDFYSADDARQAALADCGGRCPRTLVFLRACAAVAQSPGGGLGSESNRWKGRSIARAMAECAKSGPGCSIVVWACTTH